jgi:hypothetical protein
MSVISNDGDSIGGVFVEATEGTGDVRGVEEGPGVVNGFEEGVQPGLKDDFTILLSLAVRSNH